MIIPLTYVTQGLLVPAGSGSGGEVNVYCGESHTTTQYTTTTVNALESHTVATNYATAIANTKGEDHATT